MRSAKAVPNATFQVCNFFEKWFWSICLGFQFCGETIYGTKKIIGCSDRNQQNRNELVMKSQRKARA